MTPPALPSLDLLGHGAVQGGIVVVFGEVYLGMLLGGLPRLKLDRSGVALLGAIAVIALNGQTVKASAQAIDLPTLVLLFAFMVVSTQLRMSGFYAAIAQRVGAMPLSRNGLMTALIAVPATLIGNRKNMLIGSVLQLSFAGYLSQALPPVLASPVLLWLAWWGPWRPRRRWRHGHGCTGHRRRPPLDA